MNLLKNSQYKKFVCGIIAMMMLVFVLLSAAFIAAESDHNCTGEDCPVCECIQLCENTLRKLGGGTVPVVFLFLPVVFFSFSFYIPAFTCGQDTPVTRKVRLNN
ncbi:hypothetical protein [Oribacterium sp. WCC10]|uniref:hypothetical protein n=1 Tax=Oribacterium sp. WCC10 TaxID=1855343 RepID=UPI001113F976|nr:hypothetical protein [Oribacterium sp. WCC10]